MLLIDRLEKEYEIGTLPSQSKNAETIFCHCECVSCIE